METISITDLSGFAHIINKTHIVDIAFFDEHTNINLSNKETIATDLNEERVRAILKK
ncbi:MAG: hypothetical protein AAFQ20_00015 [Bacteroidota bacterium]